MVKNRLGTVSGFFKEPTEKKWAAALNAGLTEAEVSTDYTLSDAAWFEKTKRDCETVRAGGLNVSSLHLPFGNTRDISALEEPGCSDVVENTKKLLDWMAFQNIGIAVLHPSFEPIADNERAERLAKAAGSIKTLGQYAKERGIVLAVENLPRTCLGNCAEELLYLTDHGKNASICFDVNHLLKETHRDFYENVAPYVVTTHLSDYDRANERHWFPGDGCIDWAELAALFKKHRYKGRFIFEINEMSSPKSDTAVSPYELVQRFKNLIKG